MVFGSGVAAIVGFVVAAPLAGRRRRGQAS